jgi:large subunit ribosomal protein L6
MSRIGRKPVELPPGVEASIGEKAIRIKGPLGELEQTLPPHVAVAQGNNTVNVSILDGAPGRESGAMQGLARALIANMVQGVKEGYERSLNLIGVGYRVRGQGQKLTLTLGFTEPVIYELPQGMTYEIRDAEGQKENQLVLRGIDKAVIGQVAADIRRLRPPEPFKGKGIRYTGEKIRQKAGKAGAR